MFHYFDTITNTRGDSLAGWQVECVQLSDGSTVVPIFADENSTPISSVSGIANRAVTDENGNFDFYVPSGTYSLRIYNSSGVFQRTQRYLPMYGAIPVFGTAYAETFNGDGVTTAFTLDVDGGSVNNLDVSIDGVTQVPTTDYTLSASPNRTLTFTTAPPNGTIILVKYSRVLTNTVAAAGDVLFNSGSTLQDLEGSGGSALVGKSGGGTVQDAITASEAITTRIRADNGSGNLIFGSTTSGDLLNNTPAGTKNGDINTSFGIQTMVNATSSYACAAFGYASLFALTTGHSNTALGYQAGLNLTTGIMNTLVGVDAGFISTAMNRSVVVGHHCLNVGNFAGEGLIAIGQQTARNLTSGDDHIVIGRNAQASSPGSGSGGSVVIGAASALASSVSNSVMVGKDIMQSGGAGTRTITDSVLFGYRAMFGVRSSSGDCVVGQFALFQNDGSTVDSARNTAYGGEAGYYVGGTNNVFFGYRCGAHASPISLTGVVAIGYRAGDVVGGASALSNNDFVIANAEIDSRRILWGNFVTRTLNMGGVLNVAGRINADGGLKISGTAPPANSSATGEVGEIRTDADFIYVCTAANTWKRVAIATW